MRAAFLFMIWAVLWIGGCSDEATDRCANVECATGVCLPDTGVCGNPSACDEDTACLAGYSCLFDVCRADIECREDGTCQRGTCVDGACVNPQSCEILSQCLSNHACVDGQCVFDRCAEVECGRGECAKDSGECVNKTVCAEESQREDCVEGFVCYGQVCTETFEVCRDITCDRGVCDARSKACANAETCVSDMECLDNNFCNDENRCQANVCDAQMVNCELGVCDLRTGECINATTCAAANQCTDGFSCIAGQCVAQGAECGEPGCPGNQVCEVNTATLSATCGENTTGCNTAFDCLGERICRLGVCQDGTVCTPDSFEPNNTVATDFSAVATASSLQATVCRADVDLYTYDTRDSALFTGTLLAVLAFDREDVGLGNALLEIVDGTGAVVASATTSASGSARAEFAVTALKRGIYTIRVTDVDLKQSGARYRLYIDFLDAVAAQACVSPRMLVAGDNFTENSTSGASYQLGSSCTSPSNPAGENIYAFTLATPSYVDLKITPINNALLSYAVRRQCEISTDDLACQAPGSSSALRYQKVLSPGTYFVVVQGNGSQSGGSYTLEFSSNETVCSEADNQCVGANMNFTYFCNQTGTGFLTAQCANGCDPASGNCLRKATDVCGTAADATGGLTATVSWSTLTNDYDPGAGGCVPDSSGTQTNGPDAAHQVVVPPQSRVRAQLTRNIGDYVSVYILTDCSDMLSCVAGANSGAFNDETVVWVNDTAMPRTVYVIADIEQASTYGTSTITIDVAPVVCQPSASTCVADTRQVCNADGTASTLTPCTFGCAAGACLPVTNDVCSGAIDLGAGAFTGQIGEYLSDYFPSTACTGRSASNKDASFFVTPPAGQVVTASVQAGFDSALYVLRDCAAASTSCVIGSDVASTNNETVQWLADGSTYYVIVDANSSLATGEFTVSASWQPPQCVPGANLGCSGTSLSYCSEVGVPTTYACQDGCVANACGTPSGQICADAVTISDGGSVTAPFSGVNSINPGVGQHGACNFLASETPVGSDVIYTASLRAGEYLFADYTSTSSFAMMYLLTDCSDTDSCVAVTADGTSGSIVYQAPQNQVVYIVMDRSTTGTTTLTHTLNVTIKAPDCTPGQPNLCSDGNTLSYCDAYGITRTYSCASQGGCSAGACGQPSGNVCADPIVLTPGVSVTGTLNRSNATNALTLRGPQSGACYIDDAINTLGNDTIYAVDLFPGDVLRAQLTTTSTSAFIAILDNCAADSCVASPVSSGATSVAAYAPTGGRYYIVVDATSEFTSTTPYTLLADITNNGVCSPDQGTCDTAGSFSTLCNVSGTQTKGPFACDAGCNLSGCAVSPAADACATAPNIGTGAYIIGNYGDLTADITLPNSTCAGTTASGPEAVYSVTLQTGQILHAKLRSLGQETPALYLMSDCTQGTTCKAGAVTQNYASELYYVAPSAETVYLVADTTSTLSDENFELFAEVLLPNCLPGDQICDVDGATLRYCNSYGLFEGYICDGGCSGTACVNPRGDVCADAIVLSDGDTYTGSYGAFRPDIDPGLGTCVLFDARQQDGPDAVFAVDLAAGDRLDVTKTPTTTTTGMYILDSCGGNAGAACRTAAVYGTSPLSYIAENTQRYYIVVDADSTTITSSFTISVDITPNQVCVPNGSTCNAGVVTQCTSTGTVLSSMTCAYGCGNPTACAAAPTSNDTCATATPITASAVILDSYGRYTAGLNPGNTCAKQSASGPDGVYAVTLPQGTVLTARLIASDPTVNPSLYLITDCANAAGTCLGGAASFDPTVTLKYLSPSTQTIFLVVDSDWSPDNDPFYLDIRLEPQVCTPGELSCQSGGLGTCNQYGQYDISPCFFGCAAGACNPTPNDQCAGALDVTAGGQFRAAVNLYQNDYDPMVSMVSCTGDDAAGRDAVYKMTLAQGDFVDLKLQGPTDPVLYVSTACGTNTDIAAACVAGADDTNTPEGLSFVAPSAGTYYIFADLDTTSTTGDFVLDVERRPAGACTPNARTCVDANTLNFCDDKGTQNVSVSCLGGCVGGRCGQPTGDSCADPIDATGGGLFSVNLDNFANDYNLTSTSCVGFDTPGNDAVFKIDLNSGDTLDARVTGPSSENPALYLVNNCGGIRDQVSDHACIDGNDVTGATETLVYTPSGPETVYLVVDSRSTFSDDGAFALDIFAGPPCVLGQTSCLDANTLAYCQQVGRETYYPCTGGCSNGACGTPTGDACIDALPAVIGANTGDFAGTNALDLGTGTSGACTFDSSEAQVGTDHTYYVDLNAGQTLNASFTTNSSFGIMYLTSDCAAQNACLKDTADGSSGTLSYTATAPQRVYIVIDRTLSGSDAFYTYTLNVAIN